MTSCQWNLGRQADPTRQHHERERRFTEWARLGNAPLSHAENLSGLRAARPASRYCDDELQLMADQLSEHAARVSEMIKMARDRAYHTLD